jgi:hypothetical protein
MKRSAGERRRLPARGGERPPDVLLRRADRVAVPDRPGPGGRPVPHRPLPARAPSCQSPQRPGPAAPQAGVGLDRTAPPRSGRHGSGRARADRVRGQPHRDRDRRPRSLPRARHPDRCPVRRTRPDHPPPPGLDAEATCRSRMLTHAERCQKAENLWPTVLRTHDPEATQRDPSAMSISTRSWFSRSNQRASRLCHGSVACRASAETRKVAELAVHHIPCDSCSDLTREVLHR